jgi:hypothetical protein
MGKQCRERWVNHLRPGLNKTMWTDDENARLLALHVQYGSQWTTIARYIEGRSENAVKNQWNTATVRAVVRRSNAATVAVTTAENTAGMTALPVPAWPVPAWSVPAWPVPAWSVPAWPAPAWSVPAWPAPAWPVTALPLPVGASCAASFGTSFDTSKAFGVCALVGLSQGVTAHHPHVRSLL